MLILGIGLRLQLGSFSHVGRRWRTIAFEKAKLERS